MTKPYTPRQGPTKRPIRTPCRECGAVPILSSTLYVKNPAGIEEQRSRRECGSCGLDELRRPWDRGTD